MTDDEKLAQRVTEYLDANPLATRREIMAKCHTSTKKCLKLVDLGLLQKFPKPMPLKASAKMAARISPWKDFKLPGSPITGRTR